MTDVVTLERTMPASAIRVFEMLSQPHNMVRWWGHDDMIVPEHNLDFSNLGPWYSIMESPDGTRRKVSGDVIDVIPPKFIAFTWAWHEGGPDGPRGAETKVTIEINEMLSSGTANPPITICNTENTNIALADEINDEDTPVDVVFNRYSLRSKDFQVATFDPDVAENNGVGIEPVTPEVRTFKGHILGEPDSNINAVIIANPKSDLYNPNIIRSSVGCVFTNQIATGSTSEVIDFNAVILNFFD